MLTIEYEELHKFLGNLIAEHRRIKKNWNREKLGEYTNLDPNNIGRVERGEQMPSLITFLKLMHILEIQIDEYLIKIIELMDEEENRE